MILYESIVVKNLLTKEIVTLSPSLDSPDSSYGMPCWVDIHGNSYGQCQFGVPFGFQICSETNDNLS